MQLELTRIFVKVVQQGSFSRAAELLKLPKSTVSRAVSRLENEAGTKLLLRTTRSLTLTASGRVFFDSCLGPLLMLEDARKSLQGSDSIVSGVVRVTAPEDLGSHVIAPLIGQLTEEHSALSFELNCTDEVIDLVRDGYDLAVRIGKLNPSSFKSKRLGEVILIPIAAPDYIKRHGKPRAPAELIEHTCLSFNSQTLSPRWTLRSSQKVEHAAIRPRFVSNQMSSLVKTALSGGGIALVPHYLVESELKSGNLVRVLPEWKSPGLPVSLLSPLSSLTSARLKITMERFTTAIQSVL
jgi:LysR family transcriptional regulator, regulator for bpeEF and oprC